MRLPVVLHEISSFDEELLGSVAIPIVKALSRCVTDQSLLKNQITASPDFWSILQQLHQHPEAGPLVFELLQTIVESTPPIVNADNYESTIALANDFIRAGSVGALEERQKDAVSRRPKGAKQPRYLSLSPYFCRIMCIRLELMLSAVRIMSWLVGSKPLVSFIVLLDVCHH